MVATVVSDLILVEADSKCKFLAGSSIGKRIQNTMICFTDNAFYFIAFLKWNSFYIIAKIQKNKVDMEMCLMIKVTQ